MCICVKDPEELLKQLQGESFKFDLTASEPFNFHRIKYIDKMKESYEHLCGTTKQ